MRREEYCVNPTINGLKQESDYAMHVLKLQKAKTVINTTPIEPPPHFKQQNDYNQKLRKDMLAQSEFLRSLIPTKENPMPYPPKVRDYNEIFRYKKSYMKKSSRKTKNGNNDSVLPSQFFLTENQNQKYMTPSNKRPINYYDFDKESYSPTGETILSVQSDSTDNDLNLTESPVTKNQIKRQKQVSEKFNSRYYKPERLNEENSEDDQDKTYRFQLNNNSNDNLTGIEVDDDDFDYDLILKSSKNRPDKNRAKSTPKPNSSKTNHFSDNVNSSSSNEKKDDSISEAFASYNNSPFDNDKNPSKNKTKLNNETLIKKTQKYPISPSQQLAKLDQSKSSTPSNQSEKRMIRVKRKRIIRRRVPKSKQNQNQNRSDNWQKYPEEEEDMLQKPLINYTYAKTTNGKPYQILFLKPGDPIPPNSAIIQMDTTRTVIVRSSSPLEIVETDNSTSHLQMPNNSILICPNQKSLMRKFIVKKTSITSPTMSSFVISSIDDKPLHFIYIGPDREVPANSFLVHRDSRIRVAVQGQLRISQVKLGDPLPPNSIRVPSFINQPRRTVCIVSQGEEKLNFLTVRSGEEFQLPHNSIIVHSDKFTKTAVVSQSLQPLEYISVLEGGKIPQNSIVLNSNVIKKKPPKVAVFPSKSSNNEEKKDEEKFLSFINVKNGDELPINSIVVESDDQNILAVAPFDESQKIQSILVNEGDELPPGALLVDLSQEKMIPNVAISNNEPLNIVTFSNKSEIPKDSLILKEDNKTAVALLPSPNQLLYASTKNDLNVDENSFMIESSVADKNKINRVTVISPDNQPLNIITLKSVNDLPQNSVAIAYDRFDDNVNDENNIKRVVAAITPNGQPLQMLNIGNVDDKEFLSKLPQNAHFININDNETDNENNASNKIRLAVKSPDGQPLNVITVTHEDEIPLNSTVIKNEDKAAIAVVSPNNQPLQLVTLRNGEKPPKNSYVLPKNDNTNTDDEYNYKLAVTSNNEEPLHILTLNENEEIPHDSMIIQSGDFGNIVAVSPDGKGIHLKTLKEDQNVPSNCIEIGSPIKKANLCVVSPDSSPLQFITLKHGDELPENSFVIENDDDNVIAVTSKKPIQILSVNEGEEIPKNAILIDQKTQKFAFTSPNGEPLNIMTLKANEEIPPNSKIIKKDDKTAIVISSPSEQPLLISTLKEGEEAPPNSIVYDQANKDDQNELKVALFAKDCQQLNIVTLKPNDEIPDNSIVIKSDKESTVVISSPNTKPLRCVSVNKDGEIPKNSFVLDNLRSLFVPFESIQNLKRSESYEENDIEHTDNDYNNESEYDENDNDKKFDVFNEISNKLTKNDDADSLANSKTSPRIIVESNDKEPLKFFTLNDEDEIPKNSMLVSKSLQDKYPVYVASPNNNPLKFVTPDSFDNDRNKHSNAVDITQPELFVVSPSDENKLKILTIKKGEKLPPNSAIISQDGDRIVAVVGDPDLTVNCLKPGQNEDELPPNSVKPLISPCDFTEKGENDTIDNSLGEASRFKIAVFAPPENPLYLVTLKPDDQIPLNSFPIESDSEKVVYAVSTTKDQLNCQIVKQNDPIPENSILAYDPNDKTKTKTTISIYAEKRLQFHFHTLGKDDEIPLNSFIIKGDDDYREVITSPTNSPLFFYVPKDDEKPSANVFSFTINGEKSGYDSDELFQNCAVSSYDNSPLVITMAKRGEKLPTNTAIITLDEGDNKVVALSTQSEFKPLLFHSNEKEVPDNAVFLSKSARGRFAVSSKDGKQLSYTIVKNGFDGPVPKNCLIIDTEGGPNPRSLAVVPPEGQRLIYTPLRDPSRPLQKNSVIFGRPQQDAFHSKIVVRGQDGKPLKFLTIGADEEMPENAVVIHEEAGGKKVVVQSSNKKPLQFMIINDGDQLPRNAIEIEGDDKGPIEQIVVMSSAYVNNDTNKNDVSSSDRTSEPLQYVILKGGEEAPANAAVIKREGGPNPRRLAVKSPSGHSLRYIPVHPGEEIPVNSVTFCKQTNEIDSYSNNNALAADDKTSSGVFNNTDKAAVAVTATDSEKPFQYIIAKFGDRLPKSMVALFKEGGDDSRTVALNSADESSSPLRFFFVNPGCELPPNSVFLDDNEVRKSIAITPGPSADPLLNYEEIEIGKELPPNSVVVATIQKNGKTFRVVVRSSDNSPLLPSLVRQGFEPRNAIVINRKSDKDDIFEQLRQLDILKEKRARIMAGQITTETTDDGSHSSIVTQTSLSAGAFVREALERFDLLLANGEDSLKAKKKKVTVKRKKKKETITTAEIEEEEEAKSEDEQSKTVKSGSSPQDRIFAPKTNPNQPSLTFPSGNEEEDEATEAAAFGQTANKGPISPVSNKFRTPITTLVMDKETMRRKFIESPVKYDESLNNNCASSISAALNEIGNDQPKKKSFVLNLNGSRIGASSARENSEKNDKKIESVRNSGINNKNDTFSASSQNHQDNNKEIDVNMSDPDANNTTDEDDDIDDIHHLSKKTFTFSNQFQDDMDENKNQFQKLPFSGMIELVHIDKDMVASSRQSSRSFSMKANASTPTTPKTPKTPKPTKPPPIPSSSKSPSGPNSVRFV